MLPAETGGRGSGRAEFVFSVTSNTGFQPASESAQRNTGVQASEIGVGAVHWVAPPLPQGSLVSRWLLDADRWFPSTVHLPARRTRVAQSNGWSSGTDRGLARVPAHSEQPLQRSQRLRPGIKGVLSIHESQPAALLRQLFDQARDEAPHPGALSWAPRNLSKIASRRTAIRVRL